MLPAPLGQLSVARGNPLREAGARPHHDAHDEGNGIALELREHDFARATLVQDHAYRGGFIMIKRKQPGGDLYRGNLLQGIPKSE